MRKQNLTPEQRKLRIEFNRLNVVRDSAARGQNMMRPTAAGYSDQQREYYAKYQTIIDRCDKRIAEIRAIARG